MKKVLVVLVLVGVTLLALGLGGRRILVGSGWIQPEHANGIYIQRARGLYELKHSQDVFNLRFDYGNYEWLWTFNGELMAKKGGPSPTGVYYPTGDKWSCRNLVVYDHK